MITLIIAAGIIFSVTFTVYQYLTSFSVQDLVGIFSSELQEDDENRTNILLLGHGGGDHDGADLTDTIIVASLNNETNKASMVSIPRDLWLDIPGYGSSRINKIYDVLKEKYGSEEALGVLKGGVENITGVDIPYYVKIDFQGFTKIIDSLGGVEVMVESQIDDRAYPKADQSGYERFFLSAGLQELDGETALKYARSRHSTSDFDRAERQQKLLQSIKAKAEDQKLLTSPLLLKRLYDDFTEHLETNLKISELITLGDFAKNFDQDELAMAVLKDQDIVDFGSFLYTPERELYGGAFVLIPLGNNYLQIQKFVNIVFNFGDMYNENASIQILNGDGTPGIASSLGGDLIRYGFNIQRYSNADRKDYSISHYYINNPLNTRGSEAAINQIMPELIKKDGELPEGIDDSYDITIVLGENFDQIQP